MKIIYSNIYLPLVSQKEEERLAQQLKEESQIRMAEEHKTRALMKYQGLLPFKKLISQCKRNWARAVRHRDKAVLRQCLLAWRRDAAEEVERKKALADEMADFLLIKQSFYRWRKFKHHQEFLERRSQRHYQLNVKAKCLQAWVTFVSVERAEVREMEATAAEHFRSYNLSKAFRGWRFLPEQMKREEEKRKRKLELRQRVAQLIPDFTPDESLTVDQSQQD